MATVVAAVAERRARARLSCAEATPAVLCRIRPGHPADVLDLSSGGALLETRRRLSPGSVIDIQWEADGRRHLTRAQVMRCEVAAVLPDTIVYRAAVRFERDLPFAPDRGGAAWQVVE
jgi:hypothetical protein